MEQQDITKADKPTNITSTLKANEHTSMKGGDETVSSVHSPGREGIMADESQIYGSGQQAA